VIPCRSPQGNKAGIRCLPKTSEAAGVIEMSLRSCAIALVALAALAGCASGGYDAYSPYPYPAYYDYGHYDYGHYDYDYHHAKPYYGGFGYRHGYYDFDADGDAEIVKKRERRKKQAIGSGNGFAGDKEQHRPKLRKKDQPPPWFVVPPDRARPHRLADNDDGDRRRPSARRQPGESDNPVMRPRFKQDRKPKGGADEPCPPKGCPNP
jgi:hypothetical protein